MVALTMFTMLVVSSIALRVQKQKKFKLVLLKFFASLMAYPTVPLWSPTTYLAIYTQPQDLATYVTFVWTYIDLCDIK